MACPRCGEVCHCHADARPSSKHGRAHRKFEVEGLHSRGRERAGLIDPEEYDSSEEEFFASLERPATVTQRFIPDAEPQAEHARAGDTDSRPLQLKPTMTAKAAESAAVGCGVGRAEDEVGADARTNAPPADVSERRDRAGKLWTEPSGDSNPDDWRQELAARLSSYRARRKPRAPKYPSLSLNFESPPCPARATTSGRAAPATQPLAAEDTIESTACETRAQLPRPQITEVNAIPTGRIIEFPRFFTPPEPSPDQLAEPICEQPGILDAPEMDLPAPALGGIVLEPVQDSPTEDRPGFEVPLRSASILRRALAAAVDTAIIGVAVAMFAYLFVKITSVIPPLRELLTAAGFVATTVWAAYQYLLLTYSGTTPGLRAAGLRLEAFDGSAVRRRIRRWRVLASILSAVSLGLGFAWCFLDEDALCWHDRITRTHLAIRE